MKGVTGTTVAPGKPGKPLKGTAKGKVVHHGGGIGGVANTILGIEGKITPSLSTAAGPEAAAIAKPIGTKLTAVAKVAAKEPGGLAGRTIEELPKNLNAMLMGTGRTVLETGAELGHVSPLGKYSPVGKFAEKTLGLKPGYPGEAATELAKTAAGEYIGPHARYGKSLKAEEQELEKRGLTPELTDAAAIIGPVVRGVGEAHAQAIKASGVGKAELPKVRAYRDAVTHALQAPDVQEYLRRKDAIPQKPTPEEFKAAKKRENVEPRPHLRQASGREPANLKRGGAVVEQPRSGNYYRARLQTSLDDRRRAYVQGQLQKVMEARQTAENHPRLPGSSIGVPYASQLAYDLRRGEVAPLMQPGGRLSHRFLGAERAQHIGQAYAKGKNVRGRRAIVEPYTHDFQTQLKKASKQQKKLLVFAKEGLLDLNDPARAVEHLQEIHDQALEGRQGLHMPISHIAKGSDVARETGSVLDHIQKHGAESVFTPEFAKLVHTIPDERLVSQMSPWVQNNPDRAIARKYLPQMQHLDQWAQRHPDHPDAGWTQNAVKQIHQLLEEGHDLRHAATTEAEHAKATDKFTTAKNLADEVAKRHRLPTDRAYIQHVRSLEPEHYLHTVSNVAPADLKRWHGTLQRLGERSTDPELVMRAIAKAVREHFSLQNVQAFEERFGVKLPRNDMTGKEVHEWLANSGRNPSHYEVMHLGKLRQEILGQEEAEHLLHYNSDPEAHARAEGEMWERAGQVAKSDQTKGASLINKAAADEMRESFRGAKAGARMAGKLKGTVSKYMLGTSLPWLTTMSAFTYPIQGLLAGATPADLAAAAKLYKPLDRIGKAQFDEKFGVDSPYRVSSHGISTERMASTLPDAFQKFADTLHRANMSPTGRLLSKANPIKAFSDTVLKMERGPRRYSRIAAATKGIKTVAIEEMVKEMHGAQTAQNRFEVKLQRLLHAGRMPQEKYVQMALENTREMEKLATHLDNAMGEWKEMTAFERQKLNKVIMFYPWLRYSMKLVAHTLPAHHPLLYTLGLKLGTWQHKDLVELLGTEPTPGSIYLNKAQPNLPPSKRQFAEVGIKQANPTLNTFLSVVAGEPNEAFDVLPPYMTSALGWAVNRNLFTGKPLKGSHEGESQGIEKGRPSPWGYFLHEDVEEPFGPLRIAGKQITKGKPQSAESAPALGLEKPVKYSKGFERKLARERAKEHESFWSNLLHETVPMIPHPATKLPLKIKIEAKEQKEAKKKARKEYARKHPQSNSGGLPELPATPELPSLPEVK
jgi:2'-5' RNA ligase